jgi:hypothetical protein
VPRNRCSKWVIRFSLLVVLIINPSSVFADESNGETDILVHGFVSQGYVQSTKNNFSAHSVKGSTEFAEAGLNFTKQFNSQLRAGVQLFARDLGRTGGYDAKFDWFFLDYRMKDWLGFRAGRIKVPVGLYNDSMDIETARIAILLPQSVYPYSNRDYLLAQTGAEIYGLYDLGNAGSIGYRFYRGSLQLDTPASVGTPTEVQDIDTPYIWGGRILWDTPLEGLKLGGSYQELKVDSDIYFTGPAQSANVVLPVSIAVGSLEYTYYGLQLTLEYSRWWVSSVSSDPSLFPNLAVTSERYYGMATYQFNNSLAAGTYYSVYYPNDEIKSERKDYQHDLSLFGRFDVSQNWIFKAEAHYIDGTAGLSSSLNGNRTLNDLERNWGLFLLKTTVLF